MRAIAGIKGPNVITIENTLLESLLSDRTIFESVIKT